MSSHREAPAISKDPVADNTDTYAFVSPDDPDTVTIISNYLPLEAPFGGPNFFEFGDDVLYEIHIDNDADGAPEITYEFEFHTDVRNSDTFLYNTGPIDSIASPSWNRRQFYSVTRVKHGHRQIARDQPALPAVQHRAGLDAELREPRRRGGPQDRRRPHRVRRPAARRLLRRPRRDIRSRRPAPVRKPAPRGDGGGARRRRHQRLRRPLDRAQDPQARADPRRIKSDRPDGGQIGNRRLDGGQPAPCADPRGRHGNEPRDGQLGAGIAPRQPAVQRGDRAARRQGPVELAAGAGRRAVRCTTSSTPSSRRCCPSCIRACSRTWPS